MDTTSQNVAVIVLAAGKGTRMRSDRAKVLHEIAGQPMLHHALRTALTLQPERIAVVVGHDGQAVGTSARQIAPAAVICQQSEQLGTGHAVKMARDTMEGFDGQLIVLYGDTPFIRVETLARLRAHPQAITALGFETDEPGRYGRLILNGHDLQAIVEAKDASTQQLAVRTCNSGVMAGPSARMFELLDDLGNDNAQGEYYLTDLVALGRAAGVETRAILCDQAETLGINDRVELAEAEARLQASARIAAMQGGATLIAPETVHFAWDTQLGQDVVVEPNVIFGPGVQVADGARIRAFSHLEGAKVGPGCIVGPYARLRPGTMLEPDARIGNFVELKNAYMGAGAKANHLTYIGDASVGAGSNLGAGTITCNYDGFDKHSTEIGENAFVGVNTALIAPVTVGDRAYIATGTVVTRDIPEGDLAIGRTRQENKPGFGDKLREQLARKKSKK
ncbi:MAG: bifunctional UDP-N-acetylglucosamine diphosphorylase/glucosamine-1-phosphate N-acetyltransferase GlmU [Pseudomonadota bacterium]